MSPWFPHHAALLGKIPPNPSTIGAAEPPLRCSISFCVWLNAASHLCHIFPQTQATHVGLWMLNVLSAPSHAFDEQIGRCHVLPASFVLQNLPPRRANPQHALTQTPGLSSQWPRQGWLSIAHSALAAPCCEWLLLHNVWPPHKQGKMLTQSLPAQAARRGTAPTTGFASTRWSLSKDLR